MSDESSLQHDNADDVSDWLNSEFAKVPVPEGALRRALDTWEEERRQAPHPAPHGWLALLARGLRPVTATVVVAVLFLVVYRYGLRPSQPLRDTQPPATASKATVAQTGGDAAKERRSRLAAPLAQSGTRPTPQAAGPVRPLRLRRMQESAPRAPKQASAPRMSASHAPVPAAKTAMDAERGPSFSGDRAGGSSAEAEQRARTAPAYPGFAGGGGAPNAEGGLQAAAPAPRADRRATLGAAAALRKASNADLSYLNREAASAPTWTDARLAVAITMSSPDVRIADLLGLLRAQSNVELVCGADIASRTVGIECQDRPLGEVMRMLGALADLRWEQAGPHDAPKYVAVSTRPLREDATVARTSATATLERLQRPETGSVPVLGNPEAVRTYLEGLPVQGRRVDGWLLIMRREP